MTDVNALFPSKWLRAADLAGDTPATVVGVEQAQVTEAEIKPVIAFREAHLKSLVLNKTNANAISEALGTGDTRRWIGKTITLYPTFTEFQGKKVACVRVRERSAAPRQAERRADHQRPLEDDMPPVDDGWDQRESA